MVSSFGWITRGYALIGILGIQCLRAAWALPEESQDLYDIKLWHALADNSGRVEDYEFDDRMAAFAFADDNPRIYQIIGMDLGSDTVHMFLRDIRTPDSPWIHKNWSSNDKSWKDDLERVVLIPVGDPSLPDDAS